MSSEEEVQKNKANRNNRSEGFKKMRRLVVVVGLISILMLFIYFLRFNDGLSYDSNNWSAFGSYFGSVTGLLAFAGVLYSSHLSEKRAEEAEARLEQQEEESRKRYVEDSERAIFFQLLELHNKKSQSITYSGDSHIVSNQNCEGNEAFKCYVRKVNAFVTIYIVSKDIQNYNSREELINNYSVELLYICLFGNDKFDSIKCNQINLLKNKNLNNTLEYNENYHNNWATLKSKTLKPNEMFEGLNYCYDIIYRDYGHILGHYFRNMYYIIDTIDNFRGDDDYKQKYAKLFRAQLSRFEIALIICNAVSSQSTVKVITLLEKYEILNGFYNQDLFYTNNIPNNTINNSQKDKGKILINEILEEAKKQFSNGK
jgi:hypothetical protein